MKKPTFYLASVFNYLKPTFQIFTKPLLSLVLLGNFCFGQAQTPYQQIQTQLNYFQSLTNPTTQEIKKTKMLLRDEAFYNSRQGLIDPNQNGLSIAEIFADVPLDCSNGPFFSNIGPNYNDPGIQNSGYVSAVAYKDFNPNLPHYSDIIYLGTNASGFWKGIYNGTNYEWSCKTDQLRLPGLGVQSIAVHPTNSNNILIGTGNTTYQSFWNQPGYGIGILYSTDGGETFNQSNLTFNPNQTKVVFDIEFHPNNPNFVFAAVNHELYRSTDGGQTWNTIYTASYGANSNDFPEIRNLIINPHNPNELFFSYDATIDNNGYQNGGVFYIQNCLVTNINETDLTGNILPQINGINISLAQFDFANDVPNRVYLGLMTRLTTTSEPDENRLQVFSSTPPYNIWQKEFDNDGLMDPISGKFEFKMVNDGSQFMFGGILLGMGDLDGSNNLDFFNNNNVFAPNTSLHCDIRAIESYRLNASETVFLIGNDGGISDYTSDNNDSNYQRNDTRNLNGNGLVITQFYGFDSPENNSNLVLAGAQDNMHHIFRNDSWQVIGGGDGIHSAFLGEYSGINDFSAVRSSSNGEDSPIWRRVFINNNGNVTIPNNTINFSNNLNNSFRLSTNAIKDPFNNFGVFTATNEIGRADFIGFTDNASMVVTQLSNRKVNKIGYNVANPNYVYATAGDNNWNLQPMEDFVFISADNGNTFNGCVLHATQANEAYKALELYGANAITGDENNPEDFYVGYNNFTNGEGYTNHYRVIKYVFDGPTGKYKSEDISFNLPKVPVNVLTVYPGVGLFAGTDQGLYLWEYGTQNWQCFNNGIPANALVTEINLNLLCDNVIQVSTFGRGIFKANLPEQPIVRNYQSLNSAVTNWTGEINLKEGLKIKNQQDLILYNCTLRIPKNQEILVEQGGEIHLINSVVTNYCDNHLWNGIRVLGDKTISQFNQNQGRVFMEQNSLIENAKIAVKLWDGEELATTGSYIDAQNSTFRNNQWDIEFPPYQNKHANGTIAKDKSRIYGCTFEKTAPLIGGGVYNHMISLWKRNGISINNSTFRVTDPQLLVDALENTPFAHGGNYLTGIYSIDADLDLASSCAYLPQNGTLCPEQDLLANTFENLYNGVFFEKVERNPVDRVHQAIIKNCRYGIRVNAINNFTATGNHIYFEPIAGVDMATYTPLDKAVGINITNATGYQIQENEVTGLGADNFATSRQFGFRAFNTGGADNKITNNKAQHIFGGFLGQGENVLPITAPVRLGLKFLCNENSANGRDFSAAQHPQVPLALCGIAQLQKQGNLPAGNTFSQNPIYNITHYVNTTNTGIEYTYYDNDVTQEPTHYMNSVTPKAITDFNTCISDLENGTLDIGFRSGHGGLLPTIKNEFRNATNQWITALYNLNQLIDGGQTNTLLTQVQNTWPQDAVYLRDDLLAESPYLSMDVLMSVAVEDILPHAMLYQVLLANPDVSTSFEFIDFLYAETQLPLYMVQNLEAMQDTITPRTLLENDLATASFTRTQAAIHIVNYYKTDTVPGSTSADTIKYYLKQLSTFEGYLQLAETYMEEGNVTTANATLDTLLANFQLTTEQQNEANHYKQLNSLRHGITAENRTIFELTTGEKNTLQQISDTSNQFAGGIARAILRQNGVPNEPNVYIPGTNVHKRMAIRIKAEEEEKGNVNQNYLNITPTIYPNPTSGDFTVQLNVFEKNATLKVYSVAGSLVYKQSLKNGNQTIKVSTSGWSKGIYLIKVVQDKTVLFEEKLTLQ